MAGICLGLLVKRSKILMKKRETFTIFLGFNSVHRKVHIPDFMGIHCRTKNYTDSEYSFFLTKFNNVKKYNLDIESFLIEFNSKLSNG